MQTRILPNRTWPMTQVGDFISTFTGDMFVSDIKNFRGQRVITLSNEDGATRTVEAFVDPENEPDLRRITIRRPLPRFRPAGVKMVDRLTTDEVVSMAVIRKAVGG